jgi:hypothetical protein
MLMEAVTSSLTKSKIMVRASQNHFWAFLVFLLRDFASDLD